MVPDIFHEPSFLRLCGIQSRTSSLRLSNPLVQAVFGGLLIWLVAVRAFRWKRYNAIHQQFQAKYKEAIIPEEAQKIVQVSRLYDMPLLMKYASGFVVF